MRRETKEYTMNHYVWNSKRLNIDGIINFIFAFSLIYLTKSMWSTIPDLLIVRKLVKLSLYLSICFRFVYSREKSIPSKELVAYAILIIYLYVFILLNSYNTVAYLKTLLACALIMLFVLASKKQDIISVLYYYEMIIIVFAAVSFLFWIAGPMLNLIPSSGYVMTTWSGSGNLRKIENYYYLLFVPQTANFFSIAIIPRNTGVYTEAPMYSLHLSIALLIELFLKKKLNIINAIILVASIITSVSMTGYAVLVLAAFLKILGAGEKKTIGMTIKIIGVPLVLTAVLGSISFILQQRIGTGSGDMRIDDFVAGYKAWKDAPIIGTGFGNDDSYKQYMSSFRAHDKGFSNSPMQILACGGCYLFLPYLIGFYKAIKNAIGNINRLSFVILFLCIFVVTIIPFETLTIFLLFYFSLSEKR